MKAHKHLPHKHLINALLQDKRIRNLKQDLRDLESESQLYNI